MSAKITPVLMSGGAGTRLWPLSRELFPKQLLPLAGETSLLQETALRVGGAGFAAPLVVSNVEHRFAIAEQLRQSGVAGAALLLEPLAALHANVSFTPKAKLFLKHQP